MRGIRLLVSTCVLLTGGEVHAGEPGGPNANASVVKLEATYGGFGGRYVLVDTLRIEVAVTVTFDDATGLHTCSDEVRNRPGSQGLVDLFAIRAVPPVLVDVMSPAHWTGSCGYAGDDSTLVWGIADPGPPPPDWTEDGVSVYPSAYVIKPGEAVSGFTFSSPLPPGEGRFTAQAWEPISPIEAEGREPDIPFFSRGACGRITLPRP